VATDRNDPNPFAPGFAPVLNPLDFQCDKAFPLIPGHTFDRATDQEIARTKGYLNQFNPYFGFGTVEAAYECEIVETKTKDGNRSEYRPISRDRWRYNVVRFTDTPNHLREIEEASNLAEVSIEVPHAFLRTGQLGHAGRVSQFVVSIPMDPAGIANPFTLGDVVSAYHEIQAIAEGFPELRRAVGMLNALKHLPQHSEFHVLGLFAIIELLITHNPRLDDRGDSITHQMRSKFPLLSHRFKRALRYEEYFSEGSESKIWGALYRYRSMLAHGGVPDFLSSELGLLKDAGTALKFLREATRSLVRHSLSEPQLYRDLREC
jgi:hypothetical protein